MNQILGWTLFVVILVAPITNVVLHLFQIRDQLDVRKRFDAWLKAQGF